MVFCQFPAFYSALTHGIVTQRIVE